MISEPRFRGASSQTAGSGGAAALALPGLTAFSLQRDALKAAAPRRLKRRRGNARCRVRAHHPDRRKRAWRAEARAAGYHRPLTRRMARAIARRIHCWSRAIDKPLVPRAVSDFVDLVPAEQDAVLATVDQTPFFALLRAHTYKGRSRSGIRRQRELRGLGPYWLSRRSPQRDGRRAEDGRAREADPSIGLRLRNVCSNRPLGCSLLFLRKG